MTSSFNDPTARPAVRPTMRRMPAMFGATSGPRQAPDTSVQYDPASSPLRLSAYARFHTDAQAIARFLPPRFTLRGEALVAFEFSYLSEIDWLAGRGYNMLSVRVPVLFDSPERAIDGWFQPVIWENMTEPILSGREELGWNKIFAELPPPRRLGERHIFDAEWQGFRFMRLTLSGLTPLEPALGAGEPVFHHKYIPATEAWGQADVDYITMTPPGASMSRVLTHQNAQATLHMSSPQWEDMPTQHHIVQALAELPLGALHSAGLYTTRGGKDLSDQLRFS